jgi:peptidoglycan hydrolase CwlO-like protein
MVFRIPALGVSKRNKRIMSSQWRVLLTLLAAIATLCVITISPLFAVDDNSVNQGSTRIVQSQDTSFASIENRFEKIEKTLESIRFTGEKAEDRSYFNKLVSFEVFKYLKVMVALLILIALGFPLAIWLMTRSSSFQASARSQDLAETLLTIEERQAKLAHILKDIQGEIDYLQTLSAPDLKNLIQKAENYLKLNEQDLKQAGSKPGDKKK